jgi:hypothetical protein
VYIFSLEPGAEAEGHPQQEERGKGSEVIVKWYDNYIYEFLCEYEFGIRVTREDASRLFYL